MADPDFQNVTFTVIATMRRRWARQFLGMLVNMQRLGSWGSSRDITFFADGDGDYRPRFEVKGLEDEVPAAPAKEQGGNLWFDAG